ncbi:MAG: 2-phosphosulfolactate phosphatase [Bacteroidales bacterium]
MKTIEVCLSPALFQYKSTSIDYIVVVIDVLRATTAFCAAFDSGVNSIIPVSDLDKLLEYKNKGFITAAERDGKKVDFVDFGNSPSVFLQSQLHGKQLAYSTTNGTQAIELAKDCGKIAIASFSNMKAISEWLIGNDMNALILCSGWKNTFSLEDTLCAGALIELLEFSGHFLRICDASTAAFSLWQSSKNELMETVQHASHYKRLLELGLQADLEYCFQINTSKAIPIWDGSAFKNVSKR